MRCRCATETYCLKIRQPFYFPTRVLPLRDVDGSVVVVRVHGKPPQVRLRRTQEAFLCAPALHSSFFSTARSGLQWSPTTCVKLSPVARI